MNYKKRRGKDVKPKDFKNEYDPSKDSKKNLRKRSEDYLKTKTSAQGEPSSTNEEKRLIQELQVHQIELEMQNEELRITHNEAEAAASRYSDLYENAPIAYFTLNLEGSIVETNYAGAKMFSIDRSKIIGARFGLFVVESERSKYNSFFEKVISSQEVVSCEITLCKKMVFSYDKQSDDSISQPSDFVADDSPRPIFAYLEATSRVEENYCRLAVIDITNRIQAEEIRKMLETAVEHAVECIFISDRKNRINYVNRAFEVITGYSNQEAIGQTPGLLKSGKHKQEFYSQLKTTIYSGIPWQGNIINRKKNGSYYEVEATIAPVVDSDGSISHFVSVHRDVTKERESERRNIQSQRLESIGTLAGGIAHDFNNILTPIIGYTDFCLYSLPTGSKLKDDLGQVMLAATRAKELVNQILSFSRSSKQERLPMLIGPIIKEALKLLRSSLPTTIEIKQQIPEMQDAILADPTEIHQVVMNLCTNASHAMPEGGILTLELETLEIDVKFSKYLSKIEPGRYLKLSVGDNGCGIAPEIKDKIFEPYFTTKEKGRGTGLGLATTYSIINSYGGTITVYSEVGKGTVFNLYFPVVDSEIKKEVKIETLIKKGHENILFVDDDSSIAELGKRTLEFYGYKVTCCISPLEALELVKKDASAFDLMVTDMTMPGLTGEQLINSVFEIRPDMPIILCTGYSELMNDVKAANLGIKKFIRKPIPPKKLALEIREILDEKKSSTNG